MNKIGIYKMNNDIEKVEYFIGEDCPIAQTRKTKSLYLYRQVYLKNNKGAYFHIVARFRNHDEAKNFAEDFHFPLSENIKNIINKVE